MMVFFSRNPKRQQNQPMRRRTAASSDTTPSPTKGMYQRNRTLTGSSSSRVVSSAEHSADLRSPRVHAHYLANVRHKLGVILISILLLCAVLLYVISEFTAQVTVVSANGAATVTDSQASVYEEIIDEYYARHPVERLRFALDQPELLGYIAMKAPEVEQVEVRGTGIFATSQVELTMRRPVASWVIGSTQLYVDRSGAAFANNYYSDDGTVKIVDNSGVPAADGKALASNRFLSFVGKLVGATSAQGFTVEQATIPAGTTRQIDLTLKGVKYTIKCSVDRLAGEQAEDIARSVGYLKGQGAAPKYLDVRVKEKAFYR